MQSHTKTKDHFIPSRLAESPKSETLTHLPEWRAAGGGPRCWAECTLVPTSLPDASAPRPLSRGSLHRCVHVHSGTIYKSKRTWRPLKYWIKERAKALILLGLRGTRTGECNGHPTEMNLTSQDAERRQILGATGEDAIWGKMKTWKSQVPYWLWTHLWIVRLDL